MTVQVVAITSLNPDSQSALDKYLSVVGPLMHSAGAKILQRFEVCDTIAGHKEVQYVSIIEYPDAQSLRLVFDSDEYKSLENVKMQAFAFYQVSTTVIL